MNRPPDYREPTVSVDALRGIIGYTLAALAGQTSPQHLGLPPDSTPALQIATLCGAQ